MQNTDYCIVTVLSENTSVQWTLGTKISSKFSESLNRIILESSEVTMIVSTAGSIPVFFKAATSAGNALDKPRLCETNN